MTQISSVQSKIRKARIKSVLASVVCDSSGGISTVYTDGTTITGDGSQSNPLVAVGTTGALLTANNLSELSSLANAQAALQNIQGDPKFYTFTSKSSAFAPRNTDLDQLKKCFQITSSCTVTIDKDSTFGSSGLETIYFLINSGVTLTFANGAGTTLKTSSGLFTATAASGAQLLVSATRIATDTWAVQNGSPATAPFTQVTLIGSPITMTNLASGILEVSSSAGRYRTKFDFTNYTQIRFTIGCSLAGNSTAGFYCQSSTDQSSWSDIGTGTTTNIASLAAIGGAVSDWISISLGEVWIRPVTVGGDGAADPVAGLFAFQVK